MAVQEAEWQGVVELGHGAVQGGPVQTAGSSSSAAVVEAAARSRRSSAPEQARDGRTAIEGELSARPPEEFLFYADK